MNKDFQRKIEYLQKTYPKASEQELFKKLAILLNNDVGCIGKEVFNPKTAHYYKDVEVIIINNTE